MPLPPARRDHDGEAGPRQGFAGFRMTGKDPATWARFRQNLLARIEALFAQLAEDEPAGSWLLDQAKEFGTLALDAAKAQLRKPGLDAAKIEAEVVKLYAEREKALADARKTHAEARKLEIENTVNELQSCLVMTKVFLIGEGGEEAILMGRQVNQMLEALKAISGK
jgi:hypothetical protein